MADDKSKTKTDSQRPGPNNTNLDVDTMADQMQGNNQLHGNDQEDVHNQRHAVPGVKQETEGVVESFEKMDKKKRGGDAV